MNRPEATPLWRRLLRGLSILLLMATLSCAGTETAVRKDLPSEKAAPDDITFFDSSRFDARLSESLKGGHERVTTRFIGKVSVNEIPERMDKWFFMVEKYGGTVELEPTGPQARGFLTDIIALTVGAYTAIKEKIIYEPAGDYNIKVFYDADSGMIQQVVFVEKEKTP